MSKNSRAEARQKSHEGAQDLLYRTVIRSVVSSIETGVLAVGDRLPSLRAMSRNAGVSVPTVQRAYEELERLQRIEARPRSGYFVCARKEAPNVKKARVARASPTAFRKRPLVQRVFDGIDRAELEPLGIANPTMALPATKTLQRSMKRIVARTKDRAFNYSATLGEPVLRRHLAAYLFETTGFQVDPADLCITNGGQEALTLSLMTVAKAGDVIAVETPTYHGMLELIDSLGMLALEIETCPEEGVALDALERALEQHPVKVCLFATSLLNPLGVSMTRNDRQRLAQLLAERDVTLIDDDVYGELRFDGQRPVPAPFLRGAGRALMCGSFSKTVAPGYRIGWVWSSEHRDQIARLKRSMSCTSGMLSQLTLAEMLASGDYSRHLRRLRPQLQLNCERLGHWIEKAFPAGTRMSKPDGGSVLWVELPRAVRAEKLFEEALEEGISIAPGSIFSPSARFSNFVRLSFGHALTDRTKAGVDWLGRRARAAT